MVMRKLYDMILNILLLLFKGVFMFIEVFVVLVYMFLIRFLFCCIGFYKYKGVKFVEEIYFVR